MVKLSQPVLAFCIFFSSFQFFQSIWGPAGIEALAELEKYEQRLQLNIIDLENIKHQYGSEIDRLSSDATRLQDEAQRLGLISKYDIAIRTRSQADLTHFSPGKVMTRTSNSNQSNSLSLGVSLCLALLSLIVLNLLSLEPSSGRRRKGHGIRIQTASLE